MSINLETPRLNPLGQIALGGISSLLVNGGVHPISTIQSCMMAGTPMQRVGLLALYRGFGAMFGTDWAAFATAYLFNDALQGRLSELNASIAAGLISAPVICVGEGLTRNRQVNALPYAEIFSKEQYVPLQDWQIRLRSGKSLSQWLYFIYRHYCKDR